MNQEDRYQTTSWDGGQVGRQAAGQGPGRNLPGLTHIDSACVEMLAAKTVCLCGTGGVPGVDWEASKRR